MHVRGRQGQRHGKGGKQKSKSLGALRDVSISGELKTTGRQEGQEKRTKRSNKQLGSGRNKIQTEVMFALGFSFKHKANIWNSVLATPRIKT
jgi:hypothetical protein